MTAPTLESVAAVHRQAVTRGSAPVKAVEREFRVSRPTATRWVRKAREAGLIPGSRSPELRVYSPTLLAIAEDLGIDPGRLRDAVVRHGGDLRVR